MNEKELREKVAVARELLVSAERNLEVVMRGLEAANAAPNVMAGTELLEALKRVREARQVVSDLVAMGPSTSDEDGSTT